MAKQISPAYAKSDFDAVRRVFKQARKHIADECDTMPEAQIDVQTLTKLRSLAKACAPEGWKLGGKLPEVTSYPLGGYALVPETGEPISIGVYAKSGVGIREMVLEIGSLPVQVAKAGKLKLAETGVFGCAVTEARKVAEAKAKAKVAKKAPAKKAAKVEAVAEVLADDVDAKLAKVKTLIDMGFTTKQVVAMGIFA